MRSHLIRARSPRGVSGTADSVNDARDLAPFLDDAAHVPGGFATAVVFPRSEREVADLLVSADRVLPVGAQSSLTGGATPRGGVVLSTSRLRRLTVGAEAFQAGAGVTLLEVDEQLRRRGAHYPPVPTHLGATIGGIVATNAAGASTFKHGPTRNWVRALTVVLATGDVLDLRRGETLAHADGYFDLELAAGSVRVELPRYVMPVVPKLSAGYFAKPGMDLIDLFIGSEGTLGVVTAAEFRMQKVAPSCLLFVTFRDAAAGISFVRRLREEAIQTWADPNATGLDVAAIEHFDARSLALLREDAVDVRLGISLDPNVRLGLLITIDLPSGTSSEDVYSAFGSLASLSNRRGLSGLGRLASRLDAAGVLEQTFVAAPGDRTAIERLLTLREGVPLAVNARVRKGQKEIDGRIEKTAGDMIVPFDSFERMLAFYESEFERRGLDAAIWGHISDGNVHPNVIPATYADVESGREALLVFGREAIRHGGAPLAEHGVGRSVTKQRLLRELYGDRGIDEMRRVKRALDPRGVLAPGVIFDEDASGQEHAERHGV